VPQLLRTIHVSLQQPATALPRLRALSAFLAAHGRHIQQLKIDTSVYSVEQLEEGCALTAACLGACACAGSSLQELNVASRGSLTPLDWLAGMTALRRLKLTAYDSLCLPAGISRRHSLAEAEFDWGALEWDSVERLPPSLALLRFGGGETERLPTQVSEVPACCPLSRPPVRGSLLVYDSSKLCHLSCYVSFHWPSALPRVLQPACFLLRQHLRPLARCSCPSSALRNA